MIRSKETLRRLDQIKCDQIKDLEKKNLEDMGSKEILRRSDPR